LLGRVGQRFAWRLDLIGILAIGLRADSGCLLARLDDQLANGFAVQLVCVQFIPETLEIL